jgi:hypothetical protein
MRRVWLLAVLAAAAAAPAARAQTGPQLPTNDFQGAIGHLYGQTPTPAPWQHREPPLKPVPRARCDARSRPLAGMQGRVPQEAIDSPQAAKGWTCNARVVSHHATPGGFRVWRYVDPAGHACAFYDTSISGPSDVVSLAAGPTQGVVVLDMADPRRPRETARLVAPGMLAPHESLNLNARRGLLGAEPGSGGTWPGMLSLYDVKSDCRHPIHLSDTPVAPFGHESGFSRDGRTFWVAGGQGIAAVDVTDPRNPFTLTTINEFAHGLSLSPDGNTLYDTNAIDGGLNILDVSQVQARKPNPEVFEISRLTWDSTSIPQNTNPIVIRGKPYLLEYDEFAFRFNPPTRDHKVGAARLIGIGNPSRPRVVSNLRLQVNMPENHRKAANDPNFMDDHAVSYGAHYCNVPRRVNPGIAACSFLNSGLRVFDIRRPRHPREVAYFVAPPMENSGGKADSAFSQPAFDPARRHVYFTDAASGFWNVRLSRAAWPRPRR